MLETQTKNIYTDEKRNLNFRIILKPYASGTRRPPRAFLPIGKAFRQIRRQGISSFPSKNAFSERLLTKSNKESLARVLFLNSKRSKT